MTHKTEYIRLFTTNTSAKIGRTHAVSSNVVTAETANGRGTLKQSQLPGLGSGKSSEGRVRVGSGIFLSFYTDPESH